MSTHPRLKTFLLKKTLVPAVFILSFCVTSKSTLSWGDTNKRVVTIEYSRDAQRAKADLQALSQFDVLGIDRNNSTAQVQVTGSELTLLRQLGFALSFAPNTPDIAANENLDKYMAPSQVVEFLRTIHLKYPTLTKVIEVGKTRRQNTIYGIEISSNLSDTNRPAVLFNALHHAREVMTTEVTLHIIENLLANYATDSETKSWLDSYKILVVPQVNPDGNQLVHDGKTLWRKNAWTPEGTSEGQVVGVDINRNYPTDWGACNGSSTWKGSDTYRGPSAASEPEVQAMMKLVKQYRPVMNISYHAFSELIIYPFGCESRQNSSADLFKSIGLAMRAQVQDDNGKTNTYGTGPAPDVIYEADGTDIDWQWKEAGVLSFAYEVNSSRIGFQPDFEKWRNVTLKRQEGGWKEMLRQMSRSGVRGVLTPQEDMSEVQFSIRRVESTETFLWVGQSGVEPFKPRNSSGLVYQVLQPGEYEFEFWTTTGKTKTVRATVGQGMVDLGTIAL